MILWWPILGRRVKRTARGAAGFDGAALGGIGVGFGGAALAAVVAGLGVAALRRTVAGLAGVAHGRIVAGLTGAAFWLILVAGASPARAAFEIRPSAPSSSPLLPLHLPSALGFVPAWSPSAVGAWSAAALHLALDPEAGLILDAVGLRAERRRWAGRVGVTRLGLPDYTEWEADIGAGLAGGLALEGHLFRAQPSDPLRLGAGIEPRRAASLSASYVRSLGRKTSAIGWVRDVAGTGDHRALGIEPRAGVRFECTPGAGWTASLMREWGGRRRPETRLVLAWWPVTAWRLEHAMGPGRGEATALHAELGDLALSAWSGRLAAGIPSMPGFAVGYQKEPSAGDAAVAPSNGRLAEARPAPPDRPPRAASWGDWEREPGEELLVIDGAAVAAGLDADSLGVWADSLEDGANQDRAGEAAESDAANEDRVGEDAESDAVDRNVGSVDSGDDDDAAHSTEGEAAHAADDAEAAKVAGGAHPVGPVRSVHRSGRPRPWRVVPWSRLHDADIPAVDGMDAAARERFLAAVRSDGPRSLVEAIAAAPDPAVRRLLLETAPYASMHTPPPSFRGIGSTVRPAVRWSREIRSSSAGPARVSDRWEVHAASAGIGVHAAGRRPAGTDLSDESWTALLEAQGVRLVLGLGSPPLTWGTGLWLRARTFEIRTASSVGGVGSDVASGPSAAGMPSPRPRTEISIRGNALAPSSSGKDRFVAAEALLGSGATRLTAMKSGDRTWIACERQGAHWNGGVVAGVGRGPARYGLLIATAGPGGTHQAEVGFAQRGPVRFALRSAGAATLAGWGRAWWDSEARTFVPRGINSTQLVTDEDRTSPDRRLRLRGAISSGPIQANAAVQVWEDGIGPTVIDAYRAGRSLQLRTVVRPRRTVGLTLRATGSDGRSVRENDGAKHTRVTQRLCLRATAERGGAPGRRPAGADWFLDAGYDRRQSRAVPSSATAPSVRDGHWLGLAVRVRVTGRGEASVGALDVCPPRSGTLLVTPGWTGGSGFSAGRGGLWGSGRLRWRLAWFRVEGRGAWPVFPSSDRTQVAHPTWVLACGVEP